jgi:hypothetical protein
MSKKVKGPKANYLIKDLVVVKIVNWNKEVKYEIAMITNKRYATVLSPTTYDMRTEGGSGLIMVTVDNPKSKYTIMSSVTKAWLENGGTNNMWIHNRDGHTRSNYALDVELSGDGEPSVDPEAAAWMKVGQFEKCGNFLFPTQGARSY